MSDEKQDEIDALREYTLHLDRIVEEYEGTLVDLKEHIRETLEEVKTWRESRSSATKTKKRP